MALAGTSFFNVVWYWLIQGDEAGWLAMCVFLDPVYGPVVAALPRGERGGAVEIVGAALVVASVVAVARQAGRSPPTSVRTSIRLAGAAEASMRRS